MVKKSAEQGNPQAQYALAEMFYNGRGTQKNSDEAIKWYTKSIENGNIEAYLPLGSLYREKGEYIQAAQAYVKSIENGNTEAYFPLANLCREQGEYTQAVQLYLKSIENGKEGASQLIDMFFEGKEIQQNYDVVLELSKHDGCNYLKEKSRSGNDIAQNLLGDFYRYKSEGQEAEAVKEYRKSAEKGNSTAQKNLGEMYESGTGIEQDYTQAVSWYLKSAGNNNNEAAEHIISLAENGISCAQKALGDMYSNGQGVAQDYTEAIKWYEKSARQGDFDSCKKLVNIYQNGVGVEKNEIQASFWSRKIADTYTQKAKQGDTDSQSELASMYENGLGVAKDYTKAVKWYGQAAKQGSSKALEWIKNAAGNNEAEALNILGLMYLDGEGVEKNKTLSEELFRRSSEQGNADGIYYFARYSLWSKDNVKAYDLIREASDLGSPKAQFYISEDFYRGRNINNGEIIIEEDYEKAFEMFLKLAENGNCCSENYCAQNHLMAMYEKGLGVKQDQQKAFYWAYRAVETASVGDTVVNTDDLGILQYVLASLYREGEGTEKNIDKTMELYREAIKITILMQNLLFV